jgi:hypothetical protein
MSNNENINTDDELEKLRKGDEDSPMRSEQVPVTAKELLAKGWELTEQSMALVGMDIPVYLDYQIDGRGYCQVTRVATLDKLAQAIAALDEDIGRLAQGKPALVHHHSDIEQLRQDKR